MQVLGSNGFQPWHDYASGKLYFPHMSCDKVMRYHGFSCSPPWHFFGWFFAKSIPLMRQAAVETKTPMRFGEHLCSIDKVPRDDPRSGVDVWILENQSLESFWNLYYELEEKEV